MGSEITTDECEAERQHILMNNQLTDKNLTTKRQTQQGEFIFKSQTNSKLADHCSLVPKAEKDFEAKVRALK